MDSRSYVSGNTSKIPARATALPHLLQKPITREALLRKISGVLTLEAEVI